MADITTGLIEALEFLLPGFLTAWIFYGFTPYDRPSHFERIIQALLFTAIIQGLIAPLKAKGWWPASYEVPLSLLLAVILGVVVVQVFPDALGIGSVGTSSDKGFTFGSR